MSEDANKKEKKRQIYEKYCVKMALDFQKKKERRILQKTEIKGIMLSKF